MTAFVAGATGYVGKAVVRVLVERGLDVIAHVRPDSRRLAEHRAFFEALGAEVDSTAWDESAMAERFSELQPQLVFGCIGTTRSRMRESAEPQNETYDSVDYGLTAILVHACEPLSTKPRFVYVSSAGVGPKAGSPYMRARWKAETAIRDAKLPFTIARPSFLTGENREEDRPGERLGAAVLNTLVGAASAIGFRSVRQRYESMTDVEFASALVELALSEDGLDRVADARDLRLHQASN